MTETKDSEIVAIRSLELRGMFQQVSRGEGKGELEDIDDLIWEVSSLGRGEGGKSR